MDTLKNKQYETYTYYSRYTGVPYYFDTIKEQEVYGIGSNMKQSNSWTAHELVPTDTLDSLALKYYNNPTLWWIIAYYNNIQDSFMPLMNKFNIIKIPAFSSIEFGAER